jgi:hypothetical protein
MHRTLAAVIAIIALVSFTGAAPVPSDGPELRMDKKAVLVNGGQAATLSVTAGCPAGAAILEAFVYVNQNGFSTGPAPVNVPCDGALHEVTVTTTALDFTLVRGKASASGFMLLTTGDSISPSKRIQLREWARDRA